MRNLALIFPVIIHRPDFLVPGAVRNEINMGSRQGLTAEKMKDCVWLRPEAVANFEFLEWTGADHLRHTKFTGMREDKDPRKVVRET